MLARTEKKRFVNYKNSQLIEEINALAKHQIPNTELIEELEINGELDLQDEDTSKYLSELKGSAKFIALCLAHRLGKYSKNPMNLAYKRRWISKQEKALLNLVIDYYIQIWNLIINFWDDYLQNDPLILKYCPDVQNEFDLFKEIFAQEFRVQVFRFAKYDFLAKTKVEKTFSSIRSGMREKYFNPEQLEAYNFIYDRNRYYCQVLAVLNVLDRYQSEDRRLKIKLGHLQNIDYLIVDSIVCLFERCRQNEGKPDFYEELSQPRPPSYKCPRCGKKMWKDGFLKSKQRFKCPACKHKTFNPVLEQLLTSS